MTRRHHNDGTWTNVCERASCRRQCHSVRGAYRWETSWHWMTDVHGTSHEFCTERHAREFLAAHADLFDVETLTSYGVSAPATHNEMSNGS